MSANDYSRALARVAVAQLAELSGVDSCQESAVDILADLLVRYAQQLCGGAHDYAETAGRVEFNIADVLLSMDDMGVTPEELRHYADLQGEGVPFAHSVAAYPVHTQPLGVPTFLDKGEVPPPHIPPFLPAFPDPHTYQQTPSYPQHEADPTKQRQADLERKKREEEALVRLHQRLAKGAAEAPNPFMLPPHVQHVPPAAAAAAAAAADGGAAAAGLLASGALLDPGAVQRAFHKILPGKEGEEAEGEEGRPSAMDEEGGGYLYWRPDAGSGLEPVAKQPLGMSLEPGADERRRVLVGSKAPADAYQEHAAKVGATTVAPGGRQRHSKYGGDPKVRRAEEILAAAPDALYQEGMEVDEAAGGGAD